MASSTLAVTRPLLQEPPLPRPRGPLSEWVLDHLRTPPHPLDAGPAPGGDSDGDDLQLALYVCYELHYRSFAGVDEAWEWHPGLLAFRAGLEEVFEQGVRAAAGPSACDDPVEDQLWALATGNHPASTATPSLSAHVAERGTLEQVRELAVHRSAYQLKEADPHTWAIPRLRDQAKAALVEIQSDEYGGGVESQMHSTLFAATMDELGLDSRYGSYLPLLPAPTLATCNLVSLFGLHRRLRGALVGHLAVFEMTSVGPMSRYAAALRRLGFGEEARRFYDVHVAIDGHHEVVASKMLAGGLAAAEPELSGDIVFGARALMMVEGRFANHLLATWDSGASSLRSPLPSGSPELVLSGL